MSVPSSLPAEARAFWAAVEADVLALPPDLSCAAAGPLSDDRVEVASLTFAGLGGVAISGWVARPKDPPVGVVVQFPAYATVLFPPTALAEQGFLAVAVAVRGHHPTDRGEGPGFPGLLTAGLPDPETYVYRGVYADAWQAVRLVRQHLAGDLPIALTGQSQGGALSIFAAAVCPEAVAAVAAEVPFLCAIETALSATNAFPYREVQAYLRAHPGHAAQILRTLALFDVAAFAPSLRCPVLMSIGTDDPVTPVQATRALARATPGAEVVEYQGAGHEGGGLAHRRRQARWLADRLRAAGRVDPARTTSTHR